MKMNKKIRCWFGKHDWKCPEWHVLDKSYNAVTRECRVCLTQEVLN